MKEKNRHRQRGPGLGMDTLAHAAGGATLGITAGSLGGPAGIVVGGVIGGIAGIALPYLLSNDARRRRSHGKHAS